MIKILTIIGTRPEAIKTAIVHKLLLADDKFESILCSTGQHKELLSQALGCFDIYLDYELDAMKHNQSISSQMAYIMSSLQEVVDKENPSIILVQGDTLSAYCGSLVAFYNKIKLGHIEAGLRTHNKWGPYPEEIHRRHIDEVSDFHFAPTLIAQQNLLNEGHKDSSIHLTGNTGVDALIYMQKAFKNNSVQLDPSIASLILSSKKNGLVTLHRRETHGKKMSEILQNILVVSQALDLQLILPIHPNPANDSLKSFSNHPSIQIIEPLDYKNMVGLMMHCDLILSDSGGIQEEAPYLGKQVIILREETERPEALKIHSNLLYNPSTLQKDIESILNDRIEVTMPFGDGNASLKIVGVIKQSF